MKSSDLITDTQSGRKGRRSVFKKIFMMVGVLFGLMVLAAIIVPLVVDVEKYRPQIVQKVNENLNGKLELGKLGLSLWGQIKIDVDGLKLTDAKSRTVVQVKEAQFVLPFWTILTGKPELRLWMNNPTIQIFKQKDGKLNVMTLAKTGGAPAAPQTGTTTAQPGTSGGTSGGTTLPAIVVHSKFSFLLENAHVLYKDEITGDQYKIDELNLKLRNVSLSSNMPFELMANLNIAMKNGLKLTGPFVFSGNVKAEESGGEFSKATVQARASLDDAVIHYPGMLDKAKGVPLGAELSGVVGKSEATISSLKLQFSSVVLTGHASMKTENEKNIIDFKLDSNTIDLAKLGDVVSLVKNYGMNGLLDLSAEATGPTDKLNYNANVKLSKVKLQNAAMKQPLEMNGTVAIATDEVQKLTVKMNAKDFDLALNGKVQNFKAPRFQFTLNSSNMNLDELLTASEKAAEARKEQAQAITKGGGNSKAATTAANKPVVDYNAMFVPLRTNPTAAAAAGTVFVDMKHIKVTGVEMKNLKGQLQLANLVLALKDFSVALFDGNIKGGMSFNVRPVKPEVATNLTVTGLQTQRMVESQVPFARNTVKGVISANLNIGGAGINPNDVISDWKGSGTLDMKDAVFSTLDLGREIREGVLNKLPEVIKKNIHVSDQLLDWKGEYDTVAMKFALSSGTLYVNDLTGKAKPHKGMDLKGKGTVHLKDYGLNLETDFIDTYAMITDKYPDKRYGHFTLSVPVGGTLFSPKFEWDKAVGKFVQNALKEEGQKKLNEQIQKNIPKNLPGNLPAGVGKALKGIFGH